MKTYKALMVTEATHHLIAVAAKKKKLTIDEYIFFLHRREVTRTLNTLKK